MYTKIQPNQTHFSRTINTPNANNVRIMPSDTTPTTVNAQFTTGRFVQLMLFTNPHRMPQSLHQNMLQNLASNLHRMPQNLVPSRPPRKLTSQRSTSKLTRTHMLQNRRVNLRPTRKSRITPKMSTSKE
jgi:hypothetical protein